MRVSPSCVCRVYLQLLLRCVSTNVNQISWYDAIAGLRLVSSLLRWVGAECGMEIEDWLGVGMSVNWHTH